MLDVLPRIRMANLPTPMEPMKNLANSLNLKDLWIKRDDLTGVAFGGNKIRKLEYVIADAKEKGTDTLVTVGAVQSNHCRQTAAMAARAGLRCILLLAGEEPEEYAGNLLLDKLFGAEVKFFPDASFEDLTDRMAAVLETLTELGLQPYGIPPGAFMPVGTIGYVNAMVELRTQCEETGFFPERIITAAGTGGTLAGMYIGAKMAELEADIVGVSVACDAKETEERVREMVSRTLEDYPALTDPFYPPVMIDERFVGEGYGILDDGVRSAVQMFAKTEGVLLDHVYTGKAGLALIRMALAGEIEANSPTLFWHTGGQPALFSTGESLLEG
ncbi:MAG: 1-aminocyclopropane-1-carboxylate deaminase/D-cysteine desulfhydrase [Candidatus Hermodarchaeota archaeon]